jgi:hypothetical protein
MLTHKNPQHQGPTTRQGTTNLQHVCLAFPTPRGIVRVTIVDGTMQI